MGPSRNVSGGLPPAASWDLLRAPSQSKTLSRRYSQRSRVLKPALEGTDHPPSAGQRSTESEVSGASWYWLVIARRRSTCLRRVVLQRLPIAVTSASESLGEDSGPLPLATALIKERIYFALNYLVVGPLL